VLKIAVITTQNQHIMAKIVAGIVGLGVKTVGGLIINPIASSVYDTLTSALELDKSTTHLVGTASLIISPDNMTFGNVTTELKVEKKKIIRPAKPGTIDSKDQEEYALEGLNGQITLNISQFNSNLSTLNIARLG